MTPHKDIQLLAKIADVEPEFCRINDGVAWLHTGHPIRISSTLNPDGLHAESVTAAVIGYLRKKRIPFTFKFGEESERHQFSFRVHVERLPDRWIPCGTWFHPYHHTAALAALYAAIMALRQSDRKFPEPIEELREMADQLLGGNQ